MEVHPIYEEANSFIKNAIGLLTDEKQKDYFTKVSESIMTAAGMVGDNEEKMARLCDAGIKYANQLAFILFRANKLDGELLAEFRLLPTPEYTGEAVRKFEDVRQAKIDSITAQQKEVLNDQKALDVFTAVIAGMSAEEAERRMEEQAEQLRQMQG